ncbi:hypothetical protein CWC12_09535 [Pseudoalteromonas ruthenica]|nr:hypothetical protein CWC12_09535 [Pseudoalteromonas ruthenica]TMO93207.1 hypothetical protein CWC13_07195 [Pseudoalteromonas ruthenica]TMP00701.1 hypothetical protein CWC07_05160 [Pseudoalteromonas ruthenica]TMP05540.1 hypothetical protein CWC09_13560 [Pseudoalteromonas ruthenica]TMP13107.1 hypothetical protein CWC08_02785 [Pseudoalteromonas ruthenica]
MTASSSVAVEKVPFVSLLASPEKYDGKCIQTVGVLSIEFEGGSLYLDQASYIVRAFENGISQPFEAAVVVYDSENTEAQVKRLNDAYEGKLVRIVGKFQAINPSKRFLSTRSTFSSISYIQTLAPNEGAIFGNQARCL